MNTFELINRSVVRGILAIDAPSFTTNAQNWIKVNTEPTYIMLNCWLNIIDQTSAVTCSRLIGALQRDGLAKTIANADAIADKILHEEDLEYDHTWSHYLQSLLDGFQINTGRCLFGLRFAKRFTPTSSDIISKASLESFYSLNKELGQNIWTNLPFSQTAMGQELKKYFEERWSWIEDLPYDDPEYLGLAGEFSNGAANILDASKDENGIFTIEPKDSKAWTVKDNYSKVSRLVEDIAYLDNGTSMLSVGDPLKKFNLGLGDILPNSSDEDITVTLIQDVPKSMFRKRIIGIEDAKINFYANAGRKLLELYTDACCSVRITYKQQRINALAAQVASVDHVYATIDHSNASDSWGYSVTATLLPLSYVKHCERLRSRYLLDRETGVVRKNHIWLTSGHSYTYLHESHNFLYLADFATEKVDALLGEQEEPCAKPFTCGDDLYVDTRVVEFYVSLAEKLGLHINVGKSFYGPSAFRESCGVEAFEGFDVSGKKWPRAEINPDTVEGIVSLIDLQHALYDEYAAQAFLTEYIREKEPGMTSSQAFTNCTDLWEQEPCFVLAKDPYKPVTGWSALKEWCLMTESERRRALFEDAQLAKVKPIVPFEELWSYNHYDGISIHLGKRNYCYGFTYPKLNELPWAQKLKMVCGSCGRNCPQSLHSSFTQAVKPARAQLTAMWRPIDSCPYVQEPTEPAHWKPKVSYKSKGYTPWWEAWNYTKFLKDGPTYEDELLRSLGVSSSSTRYKGGSTGVARISSVISK